MIWKMKGLCNLFIDHQNDKSKEELEIIDHEILKEKSVALILSSNIAPDLSFQCDYLFHFDNKILYEI